MPRTLLAFVVALGALVDTEILGRRKVEQACRRQGGLLRVDSSGGFEH
jgi:hypothetical protein